jgi:predicted ATP-grasp superfamily ATP-dependent carboligase
VSVANAFDATKTPGNEWRFVIKPAQGAGSAHVKLAGQGTDLAAFGEPHKWRIEEYVEGMTASVSVLCGLSDAHFLRPTRQILDGEFGSYRTSEMINCNVTVDRALKLARQTIQALPKTRGYVGIDMVMGERACVVDVNPRLTTSYCYLRQIESINIAETMMKIATVASEQLKS